jgi:hypothetical protein
MSAGSTSFLAHDLSWFAANSASSTPATTSTSLFNTRPRKRSNFAAFNPSARYRGLF